MQLLNELSDLAEGDLTTTATVTEEITGAIADSINYTIDQLRVLVSAINDTAVAVSNASEETRATALHLAEASEHQAQEIAGASAAVNEMAVTIDQVSANAQECAQVAGRSVEIAKSGAGVVQNTIKGMDTIREQIQDTSKRIKRLGESSQEIGDIVSLINDIADQTNILALNAAIQASMAGDAGRGFAVVADEVQRLAERSSAATKQIEALVKTIQSDTNEAVISMEQTTAEVVRGARLAQDAGVALEEIESVSTNLAELIQNISNAARQQAASAAHISNTMNVIQEITSQTSAGTTATARSIGNLAELANNLRQSVAGFKLPEEEGSAGYSQAMSEA
jgi:twitching motility protein PilJ